MEKSIRGDNLFRINSTKGENSKKYLKENFFQSIFYRRVWIISNYPESNVESL